MDKFAASIGQEDEPGADIYAADCGPCPGVGVQTIPHKDEPGLIDTPIQWQHDFKRLGITTLAAYEERQKRIDLEFRELVVNSPKVELVESERLTINLARMGATVAVRAEGNEIVVFVALDGRPRVDVVNVHLEMPASMDGATMPCL